MVAAEVVAAVALVAAVAAAQEALTGAVVRETPAVVAVPGIRGAGAFVIRAGTLAEEEGREDGSRCVGGSVTQSVAGAEARNVLTIPSAACLKRPMSQ